MTEVETDFGKESALSILSVVLLGHGHCVAQPRARPSMRNAVKTDSAIFDGSEIVDNV